jgi:hypothetical protein
MEQVIKLVSEKTGITEAQAKTAVETVANFLKDKLPGGLGSQVDSLLSGGTMDTGNLTAGLKDMGGMFNK